MFGPLLLRRALASAVADTSATSPALQQPRPWMQHPWQQRPVSKPQATGHAVREVYLQGLVIPAVRPIPAIASTMKELECPVGVAEFHTSGNVQAHQADAALDHVQ